MNKAIPPCKNTAAKITVDFHLSDAKVAAAMYTSREVEQDCIGDVETSFIGVTEGKIVTSTGTYYARAYSNPARVKCKIPGNL